jgi:hypothetical protein
MVCTIDHKQDIPVSVHTWPACHRAEGHSSDFIDAHTSGPR